MAEQATILIPDISGFTNFTNATEIDHGAHIIVELLKLIIEANDTGFTLAEIEGDAVLFYRKGEPLPRKRLVGQCLKMFSKFHEQLMVIERDTVCRCGACQTVTDLTLKFVTHFGSIKEIRLADFVNAIGPGMIVAHRLMKNAIDSHEYILMTGPCCEAVGPSVPDVDLEWRKSSQAYDVIGDVDFEFATLTRYRAKVPRPPARPRFVINRGEDNLEIEIRAPMKTVYQTLVNVDMRTEWMTGGAPVNRDMTSERIGMQHNCIFEGMKLINRAAAADYGEEHSLYCEYVEMPDLDLKVAVYYEMDRLEDGNTRLNFNVNWMGASLPAENKMGMIGAMKPHLEALKEVCENASG
ncbi:DUF2652 domain-containing protein [Stappia sp. GBMRC 2046]|uniref:DUF2652 domain-containing protein n=1 Tax=Stappia sediminis TaxID=2692190 RepID=A0A7X3LSL9_9HYPH|nr:DUF2652 domain-containing protein [Stappia sediminis]MXN64331.1 DUF2652 domain-containing protein [Stappia sediminis]